MKIVANIAIGISVILILIGLFVKVPGYYKDHKKEVKEIKAEIEPITLKQDSLEQSIEDIKIAQRMFYDVIMKSNENQATILKKINNLRREMNEKINSVNNYTITDLDSFFRQRYSQYYNQ